MRTRRTRAWAVVGLGLLLVGCRSFAPAPGKAGAQYVATHPGLSPLVVDAIERGHVILGMDHEQVKVALGPPRTKRTFANGEPVEVWLYSGDRLHQNPLLDHGIRLFRVVFIGGRVALVEPL